MQKWSHRERERERERRIEGQRKNKKKEEKSDSDRKEQAQKREREREREREQRWFSLPPQQILLMLQPYFHKNNAVSLSENMHVQHDFLKRVGPVWVSNKKWPVHVNVCKCDRDWENGARWDFCEFSDKSIFEIYIYWISFPEIFLSQLCVVLEI